MKSNRNTISRAITAWNRIVQTTTLRVYRYITGTSGECGVRSYDGKTLHCNQKNVLASTYSYSSTYLTYIRSYFVITRASLPNRYNDDNKKRNLFIRYLQIYRVLIRREKIRLKTEALACTYTCDIYVYSLMPKNLAPQKVAYVPTRITYVFLQYCSIVACSLYSYVITSSDAIVEDEIKFFIYIFDTYGGFRVFKKLYCNNVNPRTCETSSHGLPIIL